MYSSSTIFLPLNIVSLREQLNNELNFVDLFDYLPYVSIVYNITLLYTVEIQCKRNNNVLLIFNRANKSW